jgi:hypothetical protein
MRDLMRRTAAPLPHRVAQLTELHMKPRPGLSEAKRGAAVIPARAGTDVDPLPATAECQLGRPGQVRGGRHPRQHQEERS